MLADTVERNVTQQNDFVVVLGKDAAKMLFRVLVHSAQELGVHSCYSLGCFLQALALGVFTDRYKYFPDCLLHPLGIYILAFLAHSRDIFSKRSFLFLLRQVNEVSRQQPYSERGCALGCKLGGLVEVPDARYVQMCPFVIVHKLP